MLGALTEHMHSKGSALSRACSSISRPELLPTSRDCAWLQFSQWHSQSGYTRYSWHNCGEASFSFLIAALETYIKELSLIYFSVLESSKLRTGSLMIAIYLLTGIMREFCAYWSQACNPDLHEAKPAAEKPVWS